MREAAADVGGFWIAAFGLDPPGIGGDGLERFDIVLSTHGLNDFDSECARAVDHSIDGVPVKVLPLERIIVSKRSTNGPRGGLVQLQARRRHALTAR